MKCCIGDGISLAPPTHEPWTGAHVSRDGPGAGDMRDVGAPPVELAGMRSIAYIRGQMGTLKRIPLVPLGNISVSKLSGNGY